MVSPWNLSNFYKGPFFDVATQKYIDDDDEPILDDSILDTSILDTSILNSSILNSSILDENILDQTVLDQPSNSNRGSFDDGGSLAPERVSTRHETFTDSGYGSNGSRTISHSGGKCLLATVVEADENSTGTADASELPDQASNVDARTIYSDTMSLQDRGSTTMLSRSPTKSATPCPLTFAGKTWRA